MLAQTTVGHGPVVPCENKRATLLHMEPSGLGLKFSEHGAQNDEAAQRSTRMMMALLEMLANK